MRLENLSISSLRRAGDSHASLCLHVEHLKQGKNLQLLALETAALWLPLALQAWSSEEKTVRVFFSERYENQPDTFRKALAVLFPQLFLRYPFQHYLWVAARELAPIFSSIGAETLLSPFPEKNAQQALYHLRPCEFVPERWAILRFPLGKIALRGNEEAVVEIQVLPEGHAPENPWLSQVLEEEVPPVSGLLLQAKEELRAYLRKERETLDFPILFPEGTQFQQEVWKLLENLDYGETISYLDLAKRYVETYDDIPEEEEVLKKARALTRAVGAACSANPLPLRIPCHRVIGSDGKLVGYREGTEVKAFLLDLELWERPQPKL